MEYAELMQKVDAGCMVALAPHVGADGEPSLVIVVGELPPLQRMYMDCASVAQRARIAVRAVRQVRQHYGLEL